MRGAYLPHRHVPGLTEAVGEPRPRPYTGSVSDTPGPGPETTAHCPVCGEVPRAGDTLACATCLAPHHPECWEFAQGCSLFGCGGQGTIPYPGDALELAPGGLRITEGSRPPLRLDAVALGLARRLRNRARDLPRTLSAGIGGASLSLLVYLQLLPAHGNAGMLYLAILATGILYGFLAPFLAPWQHRRPGVMTGVGVGGFGLLFLAGNLGPLGRKLELALVVFLFFHAFLFASSLSEWVAGARSALGARLGRLALPLRAALAWGSAFALMASASAWNRGYTPPSRVLWEIAIWGLVAIGTVVPALERGKSAYRERLPEETR